MTQPQDDDRDRRRAAIVEAYEAVTTGERIALSSRVEVPVVLLRTFHPSLAVSV